MPVSDDFFIEDIAFTPTEQAPPMQLEPHM
jgi:hypothetical protein